MNNISVTLQNFEGPLDLLLHLIKKDKIDIYDIPIADITRQYLQYIDAMQELDIYVAGEFLIMAATLIYIKSKMLLPKKVDLGVEIAEEAVEEDPRLPLVRRLEEYARIKEMVDVLDKGSTLYREFFPRGYTEFKLEYLEDEFDAYELVKAFYEIVKKMPEETVMDVQFETMSIVDKMNEVMDHLKERGRFQFFEYCRTIRTRIDLIIFFLSLLELSKLRIVYLRQLREFDDFEVGLKVSGDAAYGQ